MLKPNYPKTALLALAILSALFCAGCASNEQYTETGFIAPQAAQQGEAPLEEGDDPFADDPFEDDPFADDPFEEEESLAEADSQSSTPETSQQRAQRLMLAEEDEVLDPIEPVNRAVFWINDKLYTYALKPAARLYRFSVPEPARQGVGNFFSNLASPVRAVNSFLQLKFIDAAEELSRFAINSTVGILGFIDIASQNGLNSKKEDMGQTFGRYGVGHGFYLVLPFFGPSSARDTLGMAGDFVLDSNIWAVKMDRLTLVGINSLETVNAISLDKDTYEALIKQSLDPYATMRSGYLQRRKAQLAE